MSSGIDHWLESDTPLQASDAVAALIVSADGRYLMQQRDDKAEIWYPGHWGLFGGAVESGETPFDALRRELLEEIGIEVAAPRLFTTFDFDLRPIGDRKVYRMVFECALPPAGIERIVLQEGRAYGLLGAAELLTQARVTPYDAFAVWLHFRRHRFGHPPPQRDPGVGC
jgi:8-oxo-dGTP pyrophosphatase MutT (NUDIX family)